MSNISNRHAVTQFIAGESKPLTGQRLVRAGYKQTEAMTKRGEKAPPSVCASVPQIPVEQIQGNIAALLPHIATMLESAQDGILRSLYESSNYALQAVTDDDISVQACIAYLNAEAAGSRITPESVGAWFDQCISDNLLVFVADKLKFADLGEEETKTCAKHVKIWRAVMMQLAGKVRLEKKQLENLKVALTLADCGERDPMAVRLQERIKAMEAPAKKVEEMIDLL